MPRQWKIKSVTWDVTKQIFHCEIDDLFTNQFNIDDDFDGKLNFLAEIGWKLLGRLPNDN
ncbi:hypothetical protein D3C78_1175870 [compost metagenome]